VLDDVWRSEVIRAFDVGCRIVVTTRDINVMFVDQARFSVIKVDEGFTEDESLELFSKVLNIDKTGLPHQAKSVHTECKGSPMVISLISSLLQDHGVLDDGRWQYYLEVLCKRKYSKMRKVRSYEHPSVIDAISLSIDNLSEEKRGLYMDFALFQDDVRIPCSVS
jgi:apoptotic protease-activating factor